MANTSSDIIGQRLTEVIARAYKMPFSLQCDFARTNSFFVAAASSLGYITTQVSPRSHHYGHVWRATRDGLKYLEKE